MNDFKLVKPEKTVISIRLDVELLKAIDDLSKLSDVSRNEVIVQCVEYALSNIKH